MGRQDNFVTDRLVKAYNSSAFFHISVNLDTTESENSAAKIIRVQDQEPLRPIEQVDFLTRDKSKKNKTNNNSIVDEEKGCQMYIEIQRHPSLQRVKSI